MTNNRVTKPIFTCSHLLSIERSRKRIIGNIAISRERFKLTPNLNNWQLNCFSNKYFLLSQQTKDFHYLITTMRNSIASSSYSMKKLKKNVKLSKRI